MEKNLKKEGINPKKDISKEKKTKTKTDKKESTFVNKVNNLSMKQISLISLIPFLGIALYFYFEKEKEKSQKAIKSALLGTLIVFIIGVIMGVILWIMN